MAIQKNCPTAENSSKPTAAGSGSDKKATDQEQLNWRSFADPGEINPKWNAQPQTCYLIDSKGVIANKWVGSPSANVIEAALEKLIHQAEGKDRPQ